MPNVSERSYFLRFTTTWRAGVRVRSQNNSETRLINPSLRMTALARCKGLYVHPSSFCMCIYMLLMMYMYMYMSSVSVLLPQVADWSGSMYTDRRSASESHVALNAVLDTLVIVKPSYLGKLTRTYLHWPECSGLVHTDHIYCLPPLSLFQTSM